MQVLVTGSTGHLGCHLTLELARRGIAVVCSARSTTSATAEQRVSHALHLASDSRVPASVAHSVRVLEHDLLRDPPEALIQALRRAGGVQAVWHAAAVTNLNPLLAASDRHENIVMTRNLLDVAQSLGVPRFYYLGTAYQCGRADEAVREERRRERPLSFRNAYEHSKWFCEQILGNAFYSGLTVFRPSIVLGKTNGARVDFWQGYYAFIRKVHRLLQQNGKTLCEGAELGIFGREETEMDFVFVDGVVQAMASIGLDDRSCGETYHLTAPQRIRLGRIADDLAAVSGRRPLLQPQAPGERARSSPILSAVNPYLLEGPRFAREKTAWIADALGIVEPRMTEARSRHHLALAIEARVEEARLAG